jgi:hypothetical protein
MRTLPVVVVDVLMKCPFEVAPSEDEHPVQALASDGAHESLGVRVRPSRQLHLIETVRPELSG